MLERQDVHVGMPRRTCCNANMYVLENEHLDVGERTTGCSPTTGRSHLYDRLFERERPVVQKGWTIYWLSRML